MSRARHALQQGVWGHAEFPAAAVMTPAITPPAQSRPAAYAASLLANVLALARPFTLKMNRIGLSLHCISADLVRLRWWGFGLARGLLQQPGLGWQVKASLILSFEAPLCLALLQRFGRGTESRVGAPSRFIE